MEVKIYQHPEPGSHRLRFRGDTQTFTITLSEPLPGRASLRTNIGQAESARDEVILDVQQDRPPLGHDWFDIPMKRLDDRKFQVIMPLVEVGHFEGKCFFVKKGTARPLWPEGPNTVLNVEPADTCCANILYNAFVRQFGPTKHAKFPANPERDNRIQALDADGYTVIPPSGTFRDLIAELDFIIGQLGCRIIQLLPIHPTPTTYARMGRFGSPYASLSFTAVDPALAEFDPRATPLEQFLELADAVHRRNAKLLIDIAINHTGWAASLHESHPQWLVREPDGRIEVPGAWGVQWEDLTLLDYTKKDLWKYMANVFLTWCHRGVDGFRCDAGYMIPLAAWRYIVASVRKQYPDTIFLLEGLGGKISVTRDILNQGNFNWAYSELFQNFSRKQIESYLPEAIDISQHDGITVHFAETHDNNRLASRTRKFAKMRTALCALCSPNGAFGFANGVEWYATEKINVHDSPSLNWGATPNQVKPIERISRLLKGHPAFHDRTEMELIHEGDGSYIALLRRHLPTEKRLLVLANLDVENSVEGAWRTEPAGLMRGVFTDLISGKNVTVDVSPNRSSCMLAPGAVLCLTDNPADLALLETAGSNPFEPPARIQHQRLRATAMDIYRFYTGLQDLENFDPDSAARQLAVDPIEFCRGLNPRSRESRVIAWHWPRDRKRTVMIPPDHLLVVFSKAPFRAKMMDQARCIDQQESLQTRENGFFAVFDPLSTPTAFTELKLILRVFDETSGKPVQAPLLRLPEPFTVRVRKTFYRKNVQKHDLLYLGTNGRGAMLRAGVRWGQLKSKYDAMLAGNLASDYPVDRQIMLSRCRAWLVYQDYSQEICFDCFDSFCFDYGAGALWRFRVPSGQGEHVLLDISMEMMSGQNAIKIHFYRWPDSGFDGRLPDRAPVRLILRPDIENRSFHDTTKAYLGPENLFRESIETRKAGFSFAPRTDHRLVMTLSGGKFVRQPEWRYMVYHQAEAERGLDPHSDLFSPGYFSVDLTGGDAVDLTTWIETETSGEAETPLVAPQRQNISFEASGDQDPIKALGKALDQYVVRRNTFFSVIAGYPWFLDWGRDSLIVARGLIAAGKTRTARDILSLFGNFEKNGTIPNMIRGHDAGNRDTSDAPLWFCVVCAELVRAEKNKDFLDVQCNGRTVGRILISIANQMTRGTPNGIRMDPESGLIFSPAHFTWMDTDFPAATPRQGYPVEIQALWFATLSFLAEIDTGRNAGTWRELALKVQRAILDLFWSDSDGYLADCIHANVGEPARVGRRDDALRPNQLFAVTLGAVEDKAVIRQVVASCEELLVPGALRSLADRPVRVPIEIRHNGQELNDPLHPYQGKYSGDEDTRRKPAYHNGTAWTWLLPLFCEAWFTCYGPEGAQTALSFLSSSVRLMNRECVGHIPEILDGDTPHPPRGCDAQAWGVSEALRVWLQLDPR